MTEVWMERIRRLRQERNLSQAKLAVMAGMDPATLNRLEQGKGNPTIRTLEQVADVLGVGVADLLEADSPKAQAPPPLPDFKEERHGALGDADAARAAAVISELKELAVGLASVWNQDVELYEQHGRDMQPYRVLEMGAAVVSLWQNFWSALEVLKDEARQQGHNPDPATWDATSKQRLLETGASIRALAELHEVIDRSTVKPGITREDFRARREEFDAGTREFLTHDPQWPEAIEKARTVAGVA